jgi:hypothetical protein
MFDELLVRYVRLGNTIAGLEVVEAGQTVLIHGSVMFNISVPWAKVDEQARILSIVDTKGTLYEYKYEVYDIDHDIYIAERIQPL